MGKLVRDKIPDIIRRDGREPVVTVLDEVAFREALLAKLLEESAELSEAPPAQVPEEIADVLEVLHALARVHGQDWRDIERLADAKRAERGGFHDRVYLG
ncbi:nucleoside triphosphate pyrophosphohydrolase [Microbispora sp. NPDC049633]|uniref:nucleoside triphosphate pyrophosphohydrolase n=1 Tax=Microbispora sp. NPDC049633 TaxID=3154355 RepID=UPI0034321842